MSRKRYIIQNLTGILLLETSLGLWVMTPSSVVAQCGDNPPKSSCITCHVQEDPVVENGE
jgi:hypothetical protein